MWVGGGSVDYKHYVLEIMFFFIRQKTWATPEICLLEMFDLI